MPNRRTTVDPDDEDFDLCDDFELSQSEDEVDTQSQVGDTPATSPLSGSTTRPARPKTLNCPWDNCDKAFNRQARLKEHIRSHTNERPFKCPYFPCTKAFLRDSHLKHHVKSQHQKIRDHKCDFAGCDKSFTTATRLRRHIDTHEGQRFVCHYSDCGQEFRKQGTLDRHILSFHQNIKPFPCQELDAITGQPCVKAYDTAEKLRTHQRAKHDPSRFSCLECEQQNQAIRASEGFDPSNLTTATFATYGEFQAHLRIVHPPTCPQCPTSFTTKKELTRHLEVQHGVLPVNRPSATPNFPCDHEGCGKSFSKKGNLNIHIRTVHENRRDFVCGQTQIALPDDVSSLTDGAVEGCNRAFTSKASLEEHVRTAHLGLESKRMAREKKRKATMTSVDSDHLPKKRKARKDKGVKKTSAITSLVGEVSTQEDILYYGTYDPEAGDVDNDNGLLSGSVTMLGDQLYYDGNTYHFPSGEYPTSPPPFSVPPGTDLPRRNGPDGHDIMEDAIFPFEDYTLPSQHQVDDAFFGAFQQQCLEDTPY